MVCIIVMCVDGLIKKYRKISILRMLILSLILSSAATVAQAAGEPQFIDENVNREQQLAKFQMQIEDLEFEFGPYHIGLLEPLQSMITLLQEKGDYEQVAEFQNRHLQVMRTELGLEHPDLIPQLQSMVANHMLLGNWAEISDNLEYIRHLRASAEGGDPSLLLEAIDDQISWLFNRIVLENPLEAVSNFFRARELYKDMEELIETNYGKHNPESIPWLYKIAYNSFHLMQFLNGSKGVGAESIDQLVRKEGMFRLQGYNSAAFGGGSFIGRNPNVIIIEHGRSIGDDYLRDGYSLLAKIEEILQAQGDLEAQAMAVIYRADFYRLSGRGTGIRGYRKAQEMLLAAGVPEEDIHSFFSRPQIIPMNIFYASLEEASAGLKSEEELVEPLSGELVDLGLFTAWFDGLGSTPMPAREGSFGQVDLPYRYADVSFSVQPSGRIYSIDVLETGPGDEKLDRNIWRSIRDIHMRPALVDGKVRRVKGVRMRYRFPEN